MKVPSVLLSGDHKKIDAWRQDAALELTRRQRPDLLPPELLAEEKS
jgi:tRNA (guanine37-N1)-methyltransferase